MKNSKHNFAQSFTRIFTSDELPLEARIINLVFFVGILAAAIALTARAIEGMPLVTVLLMMLVLASIVLVFCLSVARLMAMQVLVTLVLSCLGIVVWPLIFFAGGGADSGMAAYFTMIIIFDFLLLRGAARVCTVVLTFAAAIVCYAGTLFWGWPVLPPDDTSAAWRFIDNIQSILVAGSFVGIIVIFQNTMCQKEKSKVEAANAEILRSKRLVTMINDASVRLLTVEPDNFQSTLVKTMERMGEYLEVDAVHIWRADERDGKPVYVLLYGWFSSKTDKEKTFEILYGATSISRAADWDDRMLGGQGYMTELTVNFHDPVRSLLDSVGIQAVMGFPVFFQGRYWGFVSFENRHSLELCSGREAETLQSASLLLANAVERNESILLLNERLAQQQLMADISRSFISKEPTDILITGALARMGEFLNVARVLVAVFEKDSDMSRPEYVWVVNSKYAPDAAQKGFSGVIRELFPRRQDTGAEVPGIYCDDTLTHDCGRFKIFREKAGLKSFICMPIYVDGELWGVLSIEEHERARKWDRNDVHLVGMVTASIASAVARDIMEKQRAAALDQAIQASRAKGDFLSNMSHEMRTPMNAIIGMTSIGKTAATIEKKDYALAKIENASKHLLGVINDILDMSKIEANRLELSNVNFDFEAMLQKVVNVINFRLDERHQQFYVNVDNKIPDALIGDDLRLSQVVTNLLSNAVKFTPENGTISLDATLVSETDGLCYVQISVTDTGIGIPGDQQTHMFKAFEQAEAGISRQYGGTGLGLAISKRIVELMNGTIWVESEPERGSKFSFTFYMRRGSQVPRRTLPEGIDWSNLRIFAVDDEPEIRQFFKDVSANLGIQCVAAASGEEAIELLAHDDNYNMFFLDWKLPGINGVELARHIHEKTGYMPIVIIFSSVDWSHIEDDALSAGVDKFLSKPLFQSSIVDIINECLNHKTHGKQDDDAVPNVDFSGHTILLAEDVDINREIVVSLLEPTGITVDCAEDGMETFKMFKDAPEKYEMIFMDVQMPRMDGYEATRSIRALENEMHGGSPYKQIPIIAMTANVFREDIERCLGAGMNAHIGKPIDFTEVTGILKKYLKGE